MKRWAVRIGMGAALGIGAIIILFAAFFLSFELSVPNYAGKARVAGLQAPVRIVRDQYAIPHIKAQSFQDAAFALGYAHAQDRLWQMEMSRRAIAGRLSELFGPSTLRIDIMMRTIGLYRAAEAAVAHLTPGGRAVLQAYADGVNAYIAQYQGRWPIEFVLAGDTAPEPWRPADSVAILKGMSFQLSENMFRELARARLMPRLGHERVQEFFQPFDEVPLPDWYETLFNPTQVGSVEIPDSTASDNWVVAGSHSETGKPLLANDPHLGYTIPSTWYLAHLSFGDEEAVGGTLPGIPAVVVGRTRHLAWGFTNTGPDTQDIYMERINPTNSNEYQTPTGWAHFDTRTETINVRFGNPHSVVVRSTRHGPVLPDVDPFSGTAPKGYVAALAWTALMPDDTTIEGTMGLNRAQNADALSGLGDRFITPMQNMVYADDAGNIGLVLPGRIPLRAPNNDAHGLVPMPGWLPQYDWQGFIPANAEPRIANPPLGYIGTANNNTTPQGYPYVLGYDWDVPYRYDRIMALLAARQRHSVQSLAAIQGDPVDTYALTLIRFLKDAFPERALGDTTPIDPTEQKLRDAANLLATWNGAMLRDRPEPLLFSAWARALSKRIFADEMGDAFDDNWGYQAAFTVRVLSNTGSSAHWCDNRNTDGFESCADDMRMALGDALKELNDAYGSDMTKWRWGDAHHAEHESRGPGGLPLIGGFFNRDIEVDGGAFTLLRQSNRMDDAHPYAASHGGAYRAVYDLANPESSLFMISTGESGNAFSPHYDDLMPLWASMRYIRIPATPAVTSGIIDLEPAQAAAP